MEIDEIFRYNVKDLRKQRGLTQEMLAEISDLSLRGIQTVEENPKDPADEGNFPRLSTVKKIAGALGVPASRLFQDPNSGPSLTAAEALLALGKIHGFEIRPIKPKKNKPSK